MDYVNGILPIFWQHCDKIITAGLILFPHQEEYIKWILEEQIKHSYFLPDTTVQLEKVCPTF